ncbi:ferric reductase-like transmembrane domain-containing protein [Luteimonas dalianensis]|uniref:ferredoxin reductase family protein n=1 Tax=Luteimonas dalianensis TaxID=1148196 RepID=UPI003BF22986
MNLGWLRFSLWMLAYMVLALVPMAIALAGPTPELRARGVETGVMFGLLALGVLSAQAVTSGRQRWFARGLGQDDLLRFHRQTGLFALVLVLAHPLTLLLADSSFLTYLDPRDELLRALSLWFVLLAATALVVSSLWRLAFGLSYERWRLLHGALALAIVTLGLGHALMVDHYTGPLWKKALLVAAVGGALYLMVETRLRRPWRMRRRPWRVAEVRGGRDDSWTLRLLPRGHAGMAFRPGQFAWLSLGDSPWTMQQHPFSMTSSADEDGAVEFTVKALGDFTSTLEDTGAGGCAWLEGPYGVFTWQPGQCPDGAVFITGGVGITPVMSMLRTARDRGAREPLWLVHASGDFDSILFREELEELEHALPLTVMHVLDEPPDDWDGESGKVDEAMLRRCLPRGIAHLPCYLCGPEPMADALEPALSRMGVPAKNLYCERFDMV